MGAQAMRELVLELLVAVQALSGHGTTPEPPEVAFVPQAELVRMACTGPCEVYGWYPGSNVIYLDDRLDPITNLRARGVLVHEIVHFVQRHHGAFANEVPCRTWALREREASLIEARWRALNNTYPLGTALGPPVWALACRTAATAWIGQGDFRRAMNGPNAPDTKVQ